MNVYDTIVLYNELVNSSVDDKLWFIQHDGAQAVTTETVVSAQDPLKTVGRTLDNLRVVPADPTTTNRVRVCAGYLYCRGRLFVFPGGQSEYIPLNPGAKNYVLVGLEVDYSLNKLELKTIHTTTDLPEIPHSVVPLAIVQMARAEHRILSSDIVDLRPFHAFDISNPTEKIVKRIPKLANGATIMIDRRPHHGEAPYFQLYETLSEESVQIVTQDFDSMEDAVPLLGEEYLDSADPEGVTLKQTIERQGITFHDTETAVYVSPYGSDSGPGSYMYPVATIQKAMEIFNNTTIKTTIYVYNGIYRVSNDTLTPTKPLTIIGETTDYVIISQGGYSSFIDTHFDIELRTLQYRCHTRKTGTMRAAIQVGSLATQTYYNCAFVFDSDEDVVPPMFETTFGDFFMTNCVIHNMFEQYSKKIVANYSAIDTLIQNTLVMGNLTDMADIPMGGSYCNIKTTHHKDPELKLRDPMECQYRPDDDSPLVDAGTTNHVGHDMDGTTPDVGIYGGSFSALADYPKYPIMQLAVFKYAVPSLFGIAIGRIPSVQQTADVPENSSLYGSVSFDGGAHWTTWDSASSSWRRIHLERLHEEGASLSEITYNLEHQPITTADEIIVAIGMLTRDPLSAPVFHQLRFEYEPRGEQLIPANEADYTVKHVDWATLVGNVSGEEKRNLVCVAY